ncbi:MAG: porin, partial [Bacteroidaceae bacterium]|nr:porin [Bacteroidaceae bacterium]
WMGNIQVQPVKDLFVGIYGWTGTYTGTNGMSVRRNRWALSGVYEHKDWSFRAEYAHHTGSKLNDTSNRADAWYTVLGVPVTPWLKIYGSYDVYRKDAECDTMRSIYGICPNFQLHKNLQFQVQYNYVNDRTAADHNYHELWAQTYVRF